MRKPYANYHVQYVVSPEGRSVGDRLSQRIRTPSKPPLGVCASEASSSGPPALNARTVKSQASLQHPTEVEEIDLRTSEVDPYFSTIRKFTPEPDISEVSDWYIPEGDENSTQVYPGPRIVTGELLKHAVLLGNRIKAQRESGATARDFRLEYSCVLFRGHTQGTVAGVMHILRRLSRDLPNIKNLGLPNEVTKLLTLPRFGENGGLILICGGAGHGKSTTASAIVAERVTNSGNFCLCVEDPPEFMLHGDYVATNGRSGKIIQVPAQGGSFAEDLRDALRCYPSNIRGSMLLIGEIRDSNTAAQALCAAVNGQLVISTIHASDPIAALERILSMSRGSLGSEEATGLLAHSLRAVVDQRIVNGNLAASCLISIDSRSSVAAGISGGNLRRLSTDLEQQKTLIEKCLLLQRIGLDRGLTNQT